MQAPSHPLVRKILGVSAALKTALAFGAEAYANGGGRAKPIVDTHFTAGNQQRYGWAPLSRDYFLSKQAGVRNKRTGKLPKSSRGSKLDTAAEFSSSTGELTGIGSGANLPMLVNSGKLRAAVSTVRHAINSTPDGSRVVIRFAGLPEYARYHHTGTGKMPRRSPVALNQANRQEVIAAIQRYLSAAMGTAGRVAVSGSSIPSTARKA
jgi:hypothetical protein